MTDMKLIITLSQGLFPGPYDRHCLATLLNLARFRAYAGSVIHHDYFPTFGLYLVLPRTHYGIKVYWMQWGQEYSILDTVVKMYLI